MHQNIGDTDIGILNIYASILDNCKSPIVTKYVTNRVHKVLKKYFKKRKPTDFPKVDYDLQVVHLVTYIKEAKYAYAFLYASSLYTINNANSIRTIHKEPDGLTFWNKIKQIFWLN